MHSALRRELSMWADFNSIDERRRILASLRFSDTPELPEEGELIRLHDDEGNSVIGIVEEIEGMVAHVRAQLETWTSTEISLESPFISKSTLPRFALLDPVTSEQPGN